MPEGGKLTVSVDDSNPSYKTWNPFDKDRWEGVSHPQKQLEEKTNQSLMVSSHSSSKSKASRKSFYVTVICYKLFRTNTQ